MHFRKCLQLGVSKMSQGAFMRPRDALSHVQQPEFVAEQNLEAPQTPWFLAGGAKPAQTHPLNGRSSHLIEAAKRGRLDQMIFFSAPLTTRAPPTTVRRPSHAHLEMSTIRNECTVQK